MSRKNKMGRRALLGSLAIAAGGSSPALLGQTGGGNAKKKVIESPKAAKPIGPYSQGIQVGNLVFVAGEKGLDAKTGKIVPGGIEPETRQALENIKAILAAAGGSLDDAVSSTVHMVDLKEFPRMNKVYGEYFRHAPPGRTTVEVPALPAGARIEITIVAAVSA
jgi:2-iminobutanoate/2-iminopropanoate deaminase